MAHNSYDGGEAVLQAFRSLGVDYVMSSPGSEWGAVWEAFARQQHANAPGPVYLSCAHETLAVDLAIGYTAVTGRMQAVMLHTGVGLLQGTMGIDAALRSQTPMLVVSGESQTYGERPGFDPGPQWQAVLSQVGSPARLAAPITKYAGQATSVEAMYQQLVSAGELAQRAPAGPVFMSVPIEQTLAPWTPPPGLRDAPAAPPLVAAAADIERVAGLLARAERPAIIAEEAGRTAAGYQALRALAEKLAIPVVEGRWTLVSNFPRDHSLHQGFHRPALIDEADLVLAVACRAPWYPPSRGPARATLVAIDETPFRPHMVHQPNLAGIFLEGDVAANLGALAAAVDAAGIDAGAVAERRARWAAAHAERVAGERAAEAAAMARDTISPVALCAALSDAAPDGAIFVEELITPRRFALAHLRPHGPQTFFRAQGGLGQSMGVATGAKLAARARPVVALMGDGSFLYNPVVQTLALAAHEALPTLTVIFNNDGYAAMRLEHAQYYPDGVSAAANIWPGHRVTGFDYAALAAPFDGYGRRVTRPGELPEALGEAFGALAEGRLAILDVALDA